MINVTRDQKNYILSGNYELLNRIIDEANHQILIAEKKYDEMLDRKNGEIARLKAAQKEVLTAYENQTKSKEIG